MKDLLLWSPGVVNQSLDPSPNLGDLIIEEYVLSELSSIFCVDPQNIPRIATHQRLRPGDRQKARNADHVFVGGSNLLSSYMDGYFQWDLIMSDALRVRNAILMGAGWWRDQGTCNRYTKYLLWAALSWKGWHSVRDGQALQHLQNIGFKRVLNTGCPTMWSLAEKDLSSISTTRATKALLMLTDYDRHEKHDADLVQLIQNSYQEVFFWPQGAGDRDYAIELGFQGTMLNRSLPALDALLASEVDLDYLGTRLHGGIRCLHSGKRGLVIEVDNRAREIGKDTKLPTVPRGDFDTIRSWLQKSAPVSLSLPTANIAKWKSQFDR
ncbi:polysaccharide pyruvyl transferase family protein [Rhodopirellula sallentina]|nr:polysaccharide pyruvyl transferase family protein [Rhodopirellula sallentina]